MVGRKRSFGLPLAPVNHTPDDPVVKHMRTDMPRLHVDLTVGEALDAIREKPPESRIIYFYVVDDDNRLRGVVPTRRLLLNPPAQSIREIMVSEVLTISSSATVLDACEYFIFHRLLAFPIVDSEHRLIGVVDVELYTEELSDIDRRAGNDELFQLIGVHLDNVKSSSSYIAFTTRFPWLLANIVGGLLAAFISGIFEAELQKAVALALFIPVVLALAESVSIQSVSLALRVMSSRRPSLNEIFRKLRMEMATGAFLGIGSGLAVASVAILWLGEWAVTLCVLGGIAGSVTCAAGIGMLMPNLIRLFNREPQVAAGPVALASTDMVTLLIYFSLARWLI
jgi:magnesium transporter